MKHLNFTKYPKVLLQDNLHNYKWWQLGRISSYVSFQKIREIDFYQTLNVVKFHERNKGNTTLKRMIYLEIQIKRLHSTRMTYSILGE